MKSLKTFPKGGVHPGDFKDLTNSEPIRNAAIKDSFIIPMSQHIGAPSECLVKPGDEVKEGMLIGKASGFISANIHSPAPGVVKEITDIFLANGMKTKAVVLEPSGSFEQLGKNIVPFDWSSMTSKELQAKIFDSGIVGLGGATFPANVKYLVPPDAKVEALVINGVECEPYLTADHRLMLEKSAEIFKGLEILQKVLNPEKIFIGIEENKPDAIDIMGKLSRESGSNIEVVPLKLKYPQGDEKQLLKAIIGREVPSGKLPINIGAVVSNVGTVFAIYEAVVLNKPLMERVLTVTGSGISKPSNLKVRIGTKVRDLVEDCGGISDDTVKLIMGGPMMGFTMCNLDTPVIKGTSGILALTEKELGKSVQTACIMCGRCVKVCPIGLVPTKLYKNITHGRYQDAMHLNLMDCKECGCCAYVCPANIPLVQGMRLGKKMANKKVKS
ncbi:MAG: electron transport complex subunit RsxC [Spirochaetia bacterium]|jgi:electron transport complex protein RnfC|nr:electron transport complex subunit RsxC [Spirochaetia bacterium]